MHPVDEMTEKLVKLLEAQQRRGSQPWELTSFVTEVWLRGITEAGEWLRDNWKDMRDVTSEPGRALADEMVHEASEGRVAGVPVRGDDGD